MANPPVENTAPPARTVGLSLDAITKIAQTIGSVAVAGTVLAALAFGVGYLAVKQHDELLGVISTTSYLRYVRTGVEFLPRTLQAIGLYLGASVVPVLIALTVVTVVALIRATAPTNTTRVMLTRAFALWPVIRVLLVVALLGIGLEVLSSQLGPLDAINTNLLLDTYHPEYEHASSEAAEVYGLLHKPAVDSVQLKAAGPHQPSAPTRLLMTYGKKAFRAAIFLYLTVLVVTSTKAVASADDRSRLRTAPLWATQRKVLEPSLLLLCAVMLLSLPPLYGVLAISTELPCVELRTPAVASRRDLESVTGRALSDMSADVKEIVLFRWGDENEDAAYSLERVNTEGITQVIGTRCEDGNVLAEKVTTYRIPAARKPAALPSPVAPTVTGARDSVSKGAARGVRTEQAAKAPRR